MKFDIYEFQGVINLVMFLFPRNYPLVFGFRTKNITFCQYVLTTDKRLLK